jgi:hypothetical protein
LTRLRGGATARPTQDNAVRATNEHILADMRLFQGVSNEDEDGPTHFMIAALTGKPIAGYGNGKFARCWPT